MVLDADRLDSTQMLTIAKEMNQPCYKLTQPAKTLLKLDRQMIRMFQRKPQFLEVHDLATVLPIFGLDQSDLLPDALIQTVSTGTRQLRVAHKNQNSLRKVSMNVEA